MRGIVRNLYFCIPLFVFVACCAPYPLPGTPLVRLVRIWTECIVVCVCTELILLSPGVTVQCRTSVCPTLLASINGVIRHTFWLVKLVDVKHILLEKTSSHVSLSGKSYASFPSTCLSVLRMANIDLPAGTIADEHVLRQALCEQHVHTTLWDIAIVRRDNTQPQLEATRWNNNLLAARTMRIYVWFTANRTLQQTLATGIGMYLGCFLLSLRRELAVIRPNLTLCEFVAMNRHSSRQWQATELPLSGSQNWKFESLLFGRSADTDARLTMQSRRTLEAACSHMTPPLDPES